MTTLFTPYEKQNEVNSLIPTLFIEAFDNYLRKKVKEIYVSFGLQEALENEWIPAELWFNTLKEIQSYFGESVVFETTKNMNLIDLDETKPDLENALASLVSFYEKNHRNGENGELIVKEFDIEKRRASIQCRTPYPDKFWNGIFLTIAKKNKPKDAISTTVSINQILPIRNDGGEHTTFIVKWQKTISQMFS